MYAGSPHVQRVRTVCTGIGAKTQNRVLPVPYRAAHTVLYIPASGGTRKWHWVLEIENGVHLILWWCTVVEIGFTPTLWTAIHMSQIVRRCSLRMLATGEHSIRHKQHVIHLQQPTTPTASNPPRLTSKRLFSTVKKNTAICGSPLKTAQCFDAATASVVR